jgi:hypothetical protein
MGLTGFDSVTEASGQFGNVKAIGLGVSRLKKQNKVIANDDFYGAELRAVA